MKKIILFFRFIWELPQNILGLIILLFIRKKVIKKTHYKTRIFYQVNKFGISLGSFIFYFDYFEKYNSFKATNQEHEFGHSIQSLIFGPLYLIVIGIPSISRGIYSQLYFKIKNRIWPHYFRGYPENWADSLGKRNFNR